MKTAVRLRGRGYPDAAQTMTPGQILFANRILEDEDAKAMDAAVIAATVGQSDAKGRKRYWETRKS